MAKSNDELLSLLHGDQTDSTELIHIIQQHCGSALQVDSLEIRYSPNCRGSHTSHDSYALRLLFSQNDNLLSIESRPSCTAELLTRLQYKSTSKQHLLR